jgi:hypothetical protein
MTQRVVILACSLAEDDAVWGPRDQDLVGRFARASSSTRAGLAGYNAQNETNMSSDIESEWRRHYPVRRGTVLTTEIVDLAATTPITLIFGRSDSVMFDVGRRLAGYLGLDIPRQHHREALASRVCERERPTGSEVDGLMRRILGTDTLVPGLDTHCLHNVVRALFSPRLAALPGAPAPPHQPAVSYYELPELGLHRAAGVELGQAFLDAVAFNPKRVHIAATHSEEMILRIVRRIGEGEVSKDICAVLYAFDSQLVHLRINDQGEFIDPWPHGFFDHRADELFW